MTRSAIVISSNSLSRAADFKPSGNRHPGGRLFDYPRGEERGALLLETVKRFFEAT
jgi:hypothetical protein